MQQPEKHEGRPSARAAFRVDIHGDGLDVFRVRQATSQGRAFHAGRTAHALGSLRLVLERGTRVEAVMT